MAYCKCGKMTVGKMDNIAYMPEITKRIIVDFKNIIENTSWKT